MTDFKLEDYFKLSESEKLALNKRIEEFIVTQGNKGLQIALKHEAKGNVENLIKATYDGYLAELCALEHLRQSNPIIKFKFIDDEAGYFKFTNKSTNSPDLIDEFGNTYEIKCYKWYNNKIYINGYQHTIDELISKFFHNADNIIFINKDRTHGFILTQQELKDKLKLIPNNPGYTNSC